MNKYLQFNVQSDHVFATPVNVYFKIKNTFSGDLYKEQVFVSEEYFPLLLKIMQSDKDLSESLAFDLYGDLFTQMIVDTQDNYGYIDDLDMSFFLEKNSFHNQNLKLIFQGEISFVKIDVEDMEEAVVLGARQLIAYY